MVEAWLRRSFLRCYGFVVLHREPDVGVLNKVLKIVVALDEVVSAYCKAAHPTVPAFKREWLYRRAKPGCPF